MNSRKILVPINLNEPKKKISGILYPSMNTESNIACLKEVSSNVEWQYGLVVLKGGGISQYDLFKSIVDSGIAIPSVDNLVETLEKYLEDLKSFKIGQIVGINGLVNDFELFLVDKSKLLK